MTTLPDPLPMFQAALTDFLAEQQTHFARWETAQQKTQSELQQCSAAFFALGGEFERLRFRLEKIEKTQVVAPPAPAQPSAPLSREVVEVVNRNTLLVQQYLQELQQLRQDYQLLWHQYETLRATLPPRP